MLKTEELYIKHHKKLIAVAFKILNNRCDAEEVVEEAFIVLIESLASTSINHPERWLYTVTKNLAKMRYRKNQRCSPIEIDENIQDTSSCILYQQCFLNGEECLIIKENSKHINGVINNQLNSLQKKCLQAYYFEELSYREIAQQENLSIGTIKSNLSRAKKKLQEPLQQYYKNK